MNESHSCNRDTIIRLLVLAGERCIALMDTQMRNLRCNRIQSDEIWSFIGKKQRHVKVDDPDEIGDAWVFVALDADTKLIPAYAVGKRNRETTYQFLADLRDRMAEEHRFQITGCWGRWALGETPFQKKMFSLT